MATLSMDLRERVLTSYQNKEGTREEIAKRYRVSLGMVKKLIQLHKKSGDIAPRHANSGRKPMFTDAHRRELKAMLAKRPDLTLVEMRDLLGVPCTIQAVHYVLVDMGLTYKKRHSGPVSRTARMSEKPENVG
jgi:transposase